MSPEEALIETVLWRPEFDGRHVAVWSDPDPGGVLHGKHRALNDVADRRKEASESAVTLW